MNIAVVLIIILAAVTIYIALVGLYTTLFKITGLASKKAFFQVISLLTAVGYTTRESENIANNPTRRKLAIACMITGTFFNLIIISLLVNIFTTFDVEQLRDSSEILLIALGVFVFLIVFFQLPFIKKPIQRLIKRIGFGVYTRKLHENVITNLDSYGESAICSVTLNVVPEQLQNKKLFETKIKDKYGINIMIIERNERPININKDTMVQKGDVLVVFGPIKMINKLFSIKGAKESALQEINNNTISIIDNYDDNALVQIELRYVPEFLQSHTIYNSPLKSRLSIIVMLIKRNDEVLNIGPSTRLMENDTVIMYGPLKNIQVSFDQENKEIVNKLLSD